MGNVCTAKTGSDAGSAEGSFLLVGQADQRIHRLRSHATQLLALIGVEEVGSGVHWAQEHPAINRGIYNMSTALIDPTLQMFRAVPKGMLPHTALAGSLQHFETCIFLIALGRFPAALTVCASSWEGVIRATFKEDIVDNFPFPELLNEVRLGHPGLATFDESGLRAFREARNRIIHHGFDPGDDEYCAQLILDVGFPFLSDCYRHLFDFYLDWRDIKSGVGAFSDLTEEQQGKAGLCLEVAEQLWAIRETNRRARRITNRGHAYVFAALAHYFRVIGKETALANAESRILKQAEDRGDLWDLHQRSKAKVKATIGGPTWEFNCPVCQEFQGLVAELAEGNLRQATITPRRGFCVKCGFAIGQNHPYLLEVLLLKQVEAKRLEILESHGVQP
jgi:hypothetical protein